MKCNLHSTNILSPWDSPVRDIILVVMKRNPMIIKVPYGSNKIRAFTNSKTYQSDGSDFFTNLLT
jgi:hypothetical protein